MRGGHGLHCRLQHALMEVFWEFRTCCGGRASGVLRVGGSLRPPRLGMACAMQLFLAVCLGAAHLHRPVVDLRFFWAMRAAHL